jgi:hypothetical protein
MWRESPIFGFVAPKITVSKTVSGGFPPTRVRIPPPPSCDVSGRMCRDIPGSRPAAGRLIGAAWVERELADQLAFESITRRWIGHYDDST